MHPLYLQKEDFVKEIHAVIKKNGIPSNKITNNWKAINNVNIIDDKIPSFCIIPATQKYGNGSERVKTTVLKILCTEKDRLYLKNILSAVWSKEYKPRGIFVPARTNLVTSPEIYKQLLKNHNRYIHQTTTVVVEGVPFNELDETALEGMKAKKETMSNTNHIKSMERTYKSKTEGKWIFIVKKKNKENVVLFLKSKMKVLFAVKTKIMSISAKARKTEQTSKALGLYVDVLRGFANPQDDSLSARTESQKEMMLNLYQGRKRQFIAVETGTAGQSKQISEVTNSGKHDFSEMIKELKREMERSQKEAMEEMQEQILNKTSLSMKELIMMMQKQLMDDVQALIKESLLPLTKMLTDLTTHHKATAMNATFETNNKNITRLRSSAGGAMKQ